MRLRVRAACATLLLLPVLPAASDPPPPTVFTSNVEWITTLPEAGAISARFVTDAAGRAEYMYLSTIHGLAVYDVSDPELPTPIGRLPLPNYENEDIDGNADLAVVSTSPGGDIYLVDTRIKNLPRLQGRLSAPDGDAHTSNCLDGCARWLYATEGSALKLVDLEQGSVTLIDYGPVGPVHDIEQDADGIVWMAGDNGVAGFAVAPLRRGSPALRARTRRATPQSPYKFTDMVVGGRNVGRDPTVNRNILHNVKRPVGAVYRQTPGQPRIGRGGVLLVTEEELRLDKDELNGEQVANCHNAGRFHTFDATGAVATGAPLRRLDTFTLAEGTLDTLQPDQGRNEYGNLFCGAHWFTVRDNVVAIAMYGAGVRFLDVSNPRDIRQVGYFASVDQQSWAAYWVPGTDLVYSVDLERGIDVLRFTGSTRSPAVRAPAPVRRSLSFLRPREDSAYGWACPVPARRPEDLR